MSSLIISLIPSLGLYSLLKCPHVLCNPLMSAHILLHNMWFIKQDPMKMFPYTWANGKGAIRCNNIKVSASMCRWVNGEYCLMWSKHINIYTLWFKSKFSRSSISFDMNNTSISSLINCTIFVNGYFLVIGITYIFWLWHCAMRTSTYIGFQ